MSKSEQILTIKTLISQLNALERTTNDILMNAKNADHEMTQYSSFRTMAQVYNDLVEQAKVVMKHGSFYTMNVDNLKSYSSTLWPEAKSILESVMLNCRLLIATLDSNIDFIGEKVSDLEQFFNTNLRKVFFELPENEKQVQNEVEKLLIGKGYNKGTDYDREAGRFNYSGRDYIPDFILPNLSECIEVKFLRDKSRKSKIIEEINADITAYKKHYSNILFIIYDLGAIRDQIEFRRDIESNDGVRIIIIKH